MSECKCRICGLEIIPADSAVWTIRGNAHLVPIECVKALLAENAELRKAAEWQPGDIPLK